VRVSVQKTNILGGLTRSHGTRKSVKRRHYDLTLTYDRVQLIDLATQSTTARPMDNHEGGGDPAVGLHTQLGTHID